MGLLFGGKQKMLDCKDRLDCARLLVASLAPRRVQTVQDSDTLKRSSRREWKNKSTVGARIHVDSVDTNEGDFALVFCFDSFDSRCFEA